MPTSVRARKDVLSVAAAALLTAGLLAAVSKAAPAIRAAPAEVACRCATDARGRVNVRRICRGVDWNDPIQGNAAIRQAAQCALRSKRPDLYFPAGVYATSVCDAGVLIRAERTGGALTVEGQGIGKTIVSDHLVPGNPACEVYAHGGTFLMFAPGSRGVVRQMTLQQEKSPRPSAAEAIRHAGGLWLADETTAPGFLLVDRVRISGWGRGVVEASDSGAPNSIDVTIDRSQFSDIAIEALINGSDISKSPHQVIRIRRSEFERIGTTCGTGHALYLRAPFKEIDIENNRFTNIVGSAIHRFGGLQSDPNGAVRIRGNTFLQTDYVTRPRLRMPCDCEPGQRYCRAKALNETMEAFLVYNSSEVVIDGAGGPHPVVYRVEITGNTFQAPHAILTENKALISGNAFRGFGPARDGIAGPWFGPMLTGPNSSGSVIANNQMQMDVGISVVASARDVHVTGNTCLRQPGSSCVVTGTAPGKVVIQGPGAVVQGNSFADGVTLEVLRAADAAAGNAPTR